jgi:uncharacterized protein (TIGR02145 family)
MVFSSSKLTAQNWWCGLPITDVRDGKTYNTVYLEPQCWMSQNLNIGTRINGIETQPNDGIIQKYCYNDAEPYCNIYGGLYQWNELVQYSPPMSGICPMGWQIPSDREWAKLMTTLDPTSNFNPFGWRGTDIGGILKSSGIDYWFSPNLGGVNTIGFSALPGGLRNLDGSFSNLQQTADFWSLENVQRFAYDHADANKYLKDGELGLSVRCFHGCKPPSIVISGIHNSTSDQIIWNWNIVANAYGYKWNYTNDFFSAVDIGLNTSKTEIGLTCNTTFTRYVWAYNDCMYTDPTILIATTAGCYKCGQSITDTRDNHVNVYNTVLIGTQCWFQQNLNIGDKILSSKDQTDNSSFEKYCYNYDDGNCTNYGGLYQWGELIQYVGGGSNTSSINPPPSGFIQGICPTTWHIPASEEWCTLTTFLDNSVNCSGFGWSGQTAGGDLKEKGISHWSSPNSGATNSSLFYGLPGGVRTISPNYYNGISTNAGFWSLSENSATWAIYTGLGYNRATVNRNYIDKANGLSIRCLRDCFTPLAPSPSTHIATPTQIIWNWNQVSEAEGYKWSTVNNFDGQESVDLGTTLSYTQTNLTCSTPYTSYIWAYRYCGHSPVTILTQSTTAEIPIAPVADIHIPSQIEIIWKWNLSENATGYMWSDQNSFSTAVDLGNTSYHYENGLICNTSYTRYLWAVNGNCGHSEVTVMTGHTSDCPFICGNIFTDNRNGTTVNYPTVLVGTQCWMQKNLNYGSILPGNQEQISNDIPEKYCYDDVESNCDNYGGLYQWGEAVQYYEGVSNVTSWPVPPIVPVQGLCPDGWHIPSYEDFVTLYMNTGLSCSQSFGLKEPGISHWTDPNVSCQYSDWLAFGSGYHGGQNNLYYELKETTRFWTTTESTTITTTVPFLSNNNLYMEVTPYYPKINANAIRCIKN